MIAVTHWPRWLRDDPSFVDHHVIRELGVHKSVKCTMQACDVDCIEGLNVLVSDNFISSVSDDSDENQCDNVSTDDKDRIEHNFLSIFEGLQPEEVDRIVLTHGLDKAGKIHTNETLVLSRLHMNDQEEHDVDGVMETMTENQPDASPSTSPVAQRATPADDRVEGEEAGNKASPRAVHTASPQANTGEGSSGDVVVEALLQGSNDHTSLEIGDEFAHEHAAVSFPVAQTPDNDVVEQTTGGADGAQHAEVPSSSSSGDADAFTYVPQFTAKDSPWNSPELQRKTVMNDQAVAETPMDDADIVRTPTWLRKAAKMSENFTEDVNEESVAKHYTKLYFNNNLEVELLGVFPPSSLTHFAAQNVTVLTKTHEQVRIFRVGTSVRIGEFTVLLSSWNDNKYDATERSSHKRGIAPVRDGEAVRLHRLRRMHANRR